MSRANIALAAIVIGAAWAAGSSGRAAESADRPLAWEQLPALPDAFGFGGPQVGVDKGVLIVAGGANFPNGPPWPVGDKPAGAKVWHDRIFALAPGDKAWRDAGRLPRPLAYAAAVSHASGVYLLGGETYTDDRKNYDCDCVTQLTWDASTQRVLAVDDALPRLPAAVSYHGAVLIGDTIYVAASYAETAASRRLDVKRLWSIDLAAPPQQRAWTSLPAWPGPARHKMAMAVAPFADGGKPPHDAIFLISGGTWVKNEAGEMDLARFEDYADAYRFDPAKSKWTRLADLPKLAESRTIDSSGYAFDRKANAWKPATDGANVDALGQQAWFNEQPRPVTAAVAACDERGRVLVFSGATGRYVTMAVQDRPLFPQEVLAYEPARDQWTVAGKMPQAVVTTGAARWQGRIVIASGEIRPGVRTPNVQALRLAEAPAHVPFGALNWTVLLLYLAGMVGIGVWCSQRESSTEQFFLAGRRIPWWAAGLSIFGTQLSAITFMAIPATAFAKDWVRMIGNLSIMPVIVFVVFCLLPLFRRLDIATAYEYLELRFNVAVRVLASSLFILFQLGRMGVVLFLPAIALSAVSGMNVNVCIVLMGVLATLYTVLGGIEAVIWTDVVQVIVLLGGALICVGVAAVDAGGVASMVDVAWQEDKFRLLVWDWSPSSFGVWVMVVGGFFTSLVPYATDQTVVQRYLTTKDERRAAGSLWLNFAMTVPAALIFYGLGTALFAFYANHPELAQPAAADRIVPWFVVRQLPAGIAGVVIAGVFAAAMSSLDSSMNSVATAYVSDFHRRFSAAATDAQCLTIAKIVTVAVGVAGTGIALWMAQVDIQYLFDYFNTLLGLVGGSLTGVFLLAALTRRGSSAGALVGWAVGAAATIATALCTDVTFYLYAAIGCLTCLAVGYGVSLLQPDAKSVAGLHIHDLKKKAHA